MPLGIAIKVPTADGMGDCLIPLVTVRKGMAIGALEKAVARVAAALSPMVAEIAATPADGGVRLELDGAHEALAHIRKSLPYCTSDADRSAEIAVPVGKAALVQPAGEFVAHGLTVTDDGAPISFHAFLGKGGSDPETEPLTCTLIKETATEEKVEGEDGDATGEERFVMGIVLSPDIVDGQGDTYSAKEVRDAAHFYMEQHQNIDLQHSFVPVDGVFILESYLAPVEFKLGERVVKQGAWVQAIRVADDEIWRAIKAGEYTCFSIGGRAVPRPVESSEKTAPT